AGYVAVEEQKVAPEVRQPRSRTEDGMPGASLLALHDRFEAGEAGRFGHPPDLVGLMTDDDDRPGHAEAPDRRQGPLGEGLPPALMQHLGPRRPHAGAQTCRQHDGTQLSGGPHGAGGYHIDRVFAAAAGPAHNHRGWERGGGHEGGRTSWRRSSPSASPAA